MVHVNLFLKIGIKNHYLATHKYATYKQIRVLVTRYKETTNYRKVNIKRQHSLQFATQNF